MAVLYAYIVLPFFLVFDMKKWAIKRGKIKKEQFLTVYYYFHKKIREDNIDESKNTIALDFFKEYLNIDSIGNPDDVKHIHLLLINDFTDKLDNDEWRRFQVYYNQKINRSKNNPKRFSITVSEEQYDLIVSKQQELELNRDISDTKKVSQSDALKELLDQGGIKSKSPLINFKKALTNVDDCKDEYLKWCYDNIEKLRIEAGKELIKSGVSNPTPLMINDEIVKALNKKRINNYTERGFVRWNVNTVSKVK